MMDRLRLFVFAALIVLITANSYSPGNAATTPPSTKNPQSNINILEMIKSCIQDSNCDESRVIFLKLLQNPKDIQTNIQYAKNVEKRGKIDLAIATYERLKLLEPNNEQWKINTERLHDLSSPPETNMSAVLGARIDSNGALSPDGDGNGAEHNGSIVLTLDQKRVLGKLKYQITSQLYSDYNHNDPTSDLILVALQFGPILNILEKWKVRTAISFDRLTTDRNKRDSFSYSVGTIFNFLNLGKGLLRSADMSLYHVDFWKETPGKDAWIFTGSGVFEYQEPKYKNKFIFSPNGTYNRAKNGQGSDGLRDLFYEIGFSAAVSNEVLENIEFGPTFSYSFRNYTDYEPGGNIDRDDHNFNVGLQATAINLIPGIVVLSSYSFERNKSKLASETYRNHSLSLSFVKSF